MLADLRIVIAGLCSAGIVRLDSSLTVGPVGGVPVAVAVLVMDPVSRSVCLVV